MIDDKTADNKLVLNELLRNANITLLKNMYKMKYTKVYDKLPTEIKSQLTKEAFEQTIKQLKKVIGYNVREDKKEGDTNTLDLSKLQKDVKTGFNVRITKNDYFLYNVIKILEEKYGKIDFFPSDDKNIINYEENDFEEDNINDEILEEISNLSQKFDDYIGAKSSRLKYMNYKNAILQFIFFYSQSLDRAYNGDMGFDPKKLYLDIINQPFSIETEKLLQFKLYANIEQNYSTNEIRKNLIFLYFLFFMKKIYNNNKIIKAIQEIENSNKKMACIEMYMLYFLFDLGEKIIFPEMRNLTYLVNKDDKIITKNVFKTNNISYPANVWFEKKQIELIELSSKQRKETLSELKELFDEIVYETKIILKHCIYKENDNNIIFQVPHMLDTLLQNTYEIFKKNIYDIGYNYRITEDNSSNEDLLNSIIQNTNIYLFLSSTWKSDLEDIREDLEILKETIETGNYAN